MTDNTTIPTTAQSGFAQKLTQAAKDYGDGMLTHREYLMRVTSHLGDIVMHENEAVRDECCEFFATHFSKHLPTA